MSKYHDSDPIPGAFHSIDGSNREERTPLLVLLDVSRSMAGAPIEQLNAALPQLKEELDADSIARNRVEVSIMTFSDIPRVVHNFTEVKNYQAPVLAVEGGTNMGAAIAAGLKHIDDRVALYEAQSIAFRRPWMFLLTDGEPTDAPRLEPLIPEIHAREREQRDDRRKLSFFPIGVENANMQLLSRLSCQRPAARLRGLNFAEFFIWVSTFVKSVSLSKRGESVPAPSHEKSFDMVAG